MLELSINWSVNGRNIEDFAEAIVKRYENVTSSVLKQGVKVQNFAKKLKDAKFEYTAELEGVWNKVCVLAFNKKLIGFI